MKITDKAVLYAKNVLLGEMQVEYEEVADLDTLAGSMVLAAGRTSMIVSTRPKADQRIALAFHMLAHRELGHVDMDFGVRQEFLSEDQPCLTPEFAEQEDEADQLVRSWFAGKNLPPGLHPLGSSSRGASVAQWILLHVLQVARGAGRTLQNIKILRNLPILQRLAVRLSTLTDGLKGRICLRRMEQAGRRIYPALQDISQQRQASRLPSRDERLERGREVEKLAKGKGKVSSVYQMARQKARM